MKYLKMTVLAVALLALAAGSAQAQECVAGVTSVNARAEGEAEQVGVITLKCRGRAARTAADELTLGSTAPKKLEISVTLNTDITNTRDSGDMIAAQAAAPTYSQGNVMLEAFTLGENQEPTTTGIVLEGSDATAGTADDLLSTGAVSDDLRTVTWKVLDIDGDAANGNTGLDAFDIGADPGGTGAVDSTITGFQLKITGLRADASGVGDGGEVTATVKVNGATVGSADMKAASVMNGLNASVKVGKGKECEDGSTSATITIQEGYKKDAIDKDDSFLITFRNIPEGVTVTVPVDVPLAADDASTTAVNERNESISLVLVQGRSGDGVAKPVDGKAMVELSATGTGEIRYTIGKGERPATDADVTAAAAETPARTITVGSPVETATSVDDALNAQEWANLMVDFSWDAGSVTMNADAMVYVSFYSMGASSIPRFVGDSEADALLTIEDCVTKLTFPFVSSATGYDTGIVVSNTSDAGGSCTASYSGSEDTEASPMIEGNSHWIFLVSTHMQDYSGRLTVTCDFGGIDGYAQINDAMGNANGYLPRM